ncbi:alpha/beta fold hydrolase [Cetobacterium sp. 2A]|uniref:YheT family hydrolase n=1 Tax=Cetobacterium sp. 2A TaxID=2754723 RepID=UPI00163BE69D|nr:alpha/beta fold hydrolase [Cetobacterium sp. 2A]MBC2854945.1 alpha/beta fold hydrolase [Cetobacterium sp. 2A]
MTDYTPSFIFKNKHINTCFPTLFRKIEIKYERERIETPDNDFLDLDWVKTGSDKLLILCHGLEGSSNSKYIKGMAKYFSERNWDILAINYRGCSEEINKQPYFYNSGCTKDLTFVVEKYNKYSTIGIVGFSLGANLILRYLGTCEHYPKNLAVATAVSPPCNLLCSAEKMKASASLIYQNQFLKSLKEKVIRKNKLYPGIYKNLIDLNKFQKIKTLMEFDEIFTAPLYGYSSSYEYYEKNSSIHTLKNIKIPTYILMPLDDPIMGSDCYPYKESENNSYIQLETPEFGGHIGFSQLEDFPYWHEQKIYDYINKISENKKTWVPS